MERPPAAPTVTTFADRALALRIERAWTRWTVASVAAYGRHTPSAEVAAEPVGDGLAAFYGPGSTLSQAQGLGLDGPVHAADFDRMERFYGRRGTPVQVEVCTLADPSVWALLGARGYRPSEPSHVLLRALAPGEVWEPALTVEPVGPDDAERFARTVLGAFFEPPHAPPADLVAVATAGVSVPSATCWLAQVSGHAAGGASSFATAGVMLFAGDGVLPAFRGRGVHDALLGARLAAAARLGCAWAATCTVPGSTSQRNAERLGFRVAYARLLFRRD
jgi:GNAT superfamily N-acetyltransferase